MSGIHEIAVNQRGHIGGRGSIPFSFNAMCTCGWVAGYNAPKWTLLAIQAHWIEKELTNGRGLLTERYEDGLAAKPAPALTDTLACSACGYTVANTEEGEESMEAHIWTNHIRVLAS